MTRRDPIHLETPRWEHGNAGSLIAIVVAVFLVGGGATYYISHVKRVPHKNEEASGKPTVTAAQEEPAAREPEPTLTEVASGVFHLDFGGTNCDTAECLKRALELVLTRSSPNRILSVAPIGVYGSPTALVIVTAWAP